MADNVVIPATGSGTATPSVATDDVGGVHYQKVKLDIGGDGVSSPVTSTGLPITDAGGSLTVDGTVTANAGTNLNTSLLALEAGGNLAGAATSLAIIDDWDEVDRAKVNTIAGQVGVQGASGVVTALTQRVVLATDVGLPAGTNAIGKLAANDGVDIGDVTINNASGGSAVNVQDGGNSLTIDNAALSVAGGGVEASALRVTIATDSTGVLSVDDNGASLTVDNPILSVVGGGTEAAAQRVTIASDSTGVLSVDDNGGSLTVDDGAGSLTVDNPALSVVGGGAEATALRVTIANDSTGVLSVDDNGGSITVDGSGTFTTQDASDGLKDVAVPTYISQVGGSDGTYLHPLRVDGQGRIDVNIKSLPAIDLNANDNIAITVLPGDDRFTIQGAPNAVPVPVVIVPSPAASWDKKSYYAQTTTVQCLKNQPGDIGGYMIYNPNSSVAYVQFFDSIGTVTLGTTRPEPSIPIPATSGANVSIVGGLKFYSGIQLACTTTATGNTAPATGLDVNLWYK